MSKAIDRAAAKEQLCQEYGVVRYEVNDTISLIAEYSEDQEVWLAVVLEDRKRWFRKPELQVVESHRFASIRTVQDHVRRLKGA